MESQENKAFLWNLMTQNGLFQDCLLYTSDAADE